jgi:hypothetical protein
MIVVVVVVVVGSGGGGGGSQFQSLVPRLWCLFSSLWRMLASTLMYYNSP